MSDDTTNQDHRPGDRWTHRAWPPGTPPAVVGRVEDGCVTWAKGRRGGAQVPNMLARHLCEALGWSRVEGQR